MMKIIGNPKPWIGNDLGTNGKLSEYEKQREAAAACEHNHDGLEIGSDNEITTICEWCGAMLEAREIDEKLLAETGELYITEWEVIEVVQTK